MKKRINSGGRIARSMLPLAVVVSVVVFKPVAYADRFDAPPRERTPEHKDGLQSGLELIPDSEFAALLAKSERHFNGNSKERAAFIPSRLPSAHSLKPYLPPAQNQGPTPQCTAYSLCYIKTAHEAIEELWDASLAQHRFSPAWLYNRLPHGPTGGTRITDGLELLKREGCATLTDSRDTHRFRIHDYYAVDPKNLGIIKSLIAGGIPLVASVHSIPALRRYRGHGVLSTYDGTPNDGYHAITVIGYDDRRGHDGALLVQNSWGLHWGDGQGRAWISYSLFTKICEQAFYAVDEPNS